MSKKVGLELLIFQGRGFEEFAKFGSVGNGDHFAHVGEEGRPRSGGGCRAGVSNNYGLKLDSLLVVAGQEEASSQVQSLPFRETR